MFLQSIATFNYKFVQFGSLFSRKKKIIPRYISNHSVFTMMFMIQCFTDSWARRKNTFSRTRVKLKQKTNKCEFRLSFRAKRSVHAINFPRQLSTMEYFVNRPLNCSTKCNRISARQTVIHFIDENLSIKKPNWNRALFDNYRDFRCWLSTHKPTRKKMVLLNHIAFD